MRMRGPGSKREALLTALMFTVATLIWVYYAVQVYLNLEAYTPLTQACTGGILVVGVVASIFHWHSWYTFDKK